MTCFVDSIVKQLKTGQYEQKIFTTSFDDEKELFRLIIDATATVERWDHFVNQIIVNPCYEKLMNKYQNEKRTSFFRNFDINYSDELSDRYIVVSSSPDNFRDYDISMCAIERLTPEEMSIRELIL